MKGQGSVVLLLGGLQKEQRCLLLRIIIGDEKETDLGQWKKKKNSGKKKNKDIISEEFKQKYVHLPKIFKEKLYFV